MKKEIQLTEYRRNCSVVEATLKAAPSQIAWATRAGAADSCRVVDGTYCTEVCAYLQCIVINTVIIIIIINRSTSLCNLIYPLIVPHVLFHHGSRLHLH